MITPMSSQTTDMHKGTGTHTVPIPLSTNRYRLLAELGRGGMATAYLADMSGPSGFHKLVVVKRLLPALAVDAEFLSMFIEEAKLGARIDHPNVVHTMEVARDSSNCFIALEYIPGQTLENMLRKASRGPDGAHVKSRLPLALHLHVLREVLTGLHYVHELSDFDGTPLRLVHRDVSPHNVMVSYEGHVKLLDFGIAKVTKIAGNTSTGVIKGKAAYMPLEQFLGSKAIDRRADVFAVGVMLWHALAGKRLWSGLDEADIFRRLHANDVPSPRTEDPSVDAEVEQICMKALAKDANDRYATAADMLIALEAYVKAHDLILSPREVGAWVAAEFDDARKKLQAVIEEQLGKPTDSAPISLSTESLPQIKEPSMTGASAMIDGSVVGTATSELKSGRRMWISALVVAVGLLALVVVLGSRLKDKRAPSPTEGGPAAGAEARTTRVVVRATPASATVLLDGARLTGDPPTIEVPRDGATHALRIEGAGYKPYEENVVASEHQILITAGLMPDDADHPAEPAPSASATNPTVKTTTRISRPTGRAPGTAAVPEEVSEASAPGAVRSAPTATHDPFEAPPPTAVPITRGNFDTNNPFKD